jgi:hypothetical protein
MARKLGNGEGGLGPISSYSTFLRKITRFAASSR